MCLIAVALLYRATAFQFKMIPLLLLIEFAAHQLTYWIGLEWLGLLGRTSIYISYMAIQVAILAYMYRNKIYSGITILILANLIYNFLTVLYHLYYTNVNFHAMYSQIVGTIMILEILYLLRIKLYVANNNSGQGAAAVRSNSSLTFLWGRFSNRNSIGEVA